MTRSNTFEEADRLGGLLGEAVAAAISSLRDLERVDLACATTTMELPRRRVPTLAEAEENLRQASERLQELRCMCAPRGEIRTAECDWFGAEANVVLAKAAVAGRLDAAVASIMPAEIMATRIGPWSFVGWPGELYVEFALAVKARRPNCHLISLANGDLQGYLVTAEAVRQRHYEALNSVLASPKSGDLLVRTTLELLAEKERRA